MARGPARRDEPKRFRRASGGSHAARWCEDDRAVMQVVEAMLALSILILAIGWAVNVSQRPSEAPVESDELRSLARQALELLDANETTDLTVREHLETCGEEHLLGEALLDILGQARVNMFIRAGGAETWIGSAFFDGDGPTSTDQGGPLPTGVETSVVRYLATADLCDDGEEARIVSLRVEVWRS